MSTLSDLQNICNQCSAIENDADRTQTEKKRQIATLNYKGVQIEDLCLTFTLPGYDDYNLVPRGCETPVDLENLQNYIDIVAQTYAVKSIELQIRCFREGLNRVKIDL